MSEPFLNKMGEELEGTEALSREMQELNEITNEPESYIETKVDLAQSEAIESTFNALVNTAQETNSGEADLNPLPIPMPYEADELYVEITTAGQDVGFLPTPLPREADEVDPSAAEPKGDFVGTMPAQPPEGSDLGETVAWKWKGQETEQVTAVYDGSSFSVQASAEAKPDTADSQISTGESSGDTNPGDTVVTPINIPEDPSPDDSSPDLIGENG
jgi:hypothetical protein